MSKTLRVGIMPGRIQEVAVELGASVADVLNIAELDATGYDIKVDGEKVDSGYAVNESTNLILLVKQVKGNAGGLVRIGVMPGRISEYAVEEGATVADAIAMAGLSTDGYEVKVDGSKVDPQTTKVTDSTGLILLAKQVKGNANGIVRVGVMPGRITEHAVQVGTSIADLISQAELDTTGYEVKVDGAKVDPSQTTVTEETNLVLLTKMVKGNK